MLAQDHLLVIYNPYYTMRVVLPCPEGVNCVYSKVLFFSYQLTLLFQSNENCYLSLCLHCCFLPYFILVESNF